VKEREKAKREFNFKTSMENTTSEILVSKQNNNIKTKGFIFFFFNF